MRITVISLISLFILSVISCQKNAEPHEANIESEYFVRYVSDALSRRYDASYTDESGKTVSLRNIAGETFERTIGPVKKGFKADFSIRGDYLTPLVRIEVKKDNEPFVVKKEASGISGYAASVSYTIE